MSYDKKKFKKRFPALSKELESKEMTMPIDEVQDPSSLSKRDNNLPTTQKSKETIEMDVLELDEYDYWRGYDPKVEDFIRRATKPEEAIEIIDYLLKRNEITSEKAIKLKKILKTKGLAAFGPPKRPGYYFEAAEKERMRESMKKSPLSKG